MRHPLCFLFNDYGYSASNISSNKEWTGYRQVFESFLQRSLDTALRDSSDFFEIAYSLAFLNDSKAKKRRTKSGEHAATGRISSLARELNYLRVIGEGLVTAQALSFRAEQKEVAERLRRSSSDRNLDEDFELPPELRLREKLRWLETKSVDGLLHRLVSGVLSNSLAVSRKVSGRSAGWRNVPILVLKGEAELQQFGCDLRTCQPPSKLMSSSSLKKIRKIAESDPTGYLALLIDALVLCAFGEWTAAANMAKRAVERSEFYSKESETRKAFDQFEWREGRRDRKAEFERQTKRIDGQEARFLCVHAIRYSARSMRDFEDASRHLRAFEAIESNDLRAYPERLALSLAEWLFMKYICHQTNIGLLKSLADRLNDSLRNLKVRDPTCSRSEDFTLEAMVLRYVWEQTTLNIAIVSIELRLLEQVSESADARVPTNGPPWLTGWAFAPNRGVSRFSQFIAAVACIVFHPNSCETLTKKSKEGLRQLIDEYSSSVPKDSTRYESKRAAAFKELANSARAVDSGE